MEPHICTHSHVILSDRSEAGNNTTEVDVMQRDIEQLAQQETAFLARPKEFILDPKGLHSSFLQVQSLREKAPASTINS